MRMRMKGGDAPPLVADYASAAPPLPPSLPPSQTWPSLA